MGRSERSKDRRYERWLSLIAECLRDHGWSVATFYEDHLAGNLLTLSASRADGLVELHVQRATKGPTPTGQLAPEDEAQRAVSANLVLVAETREGVHDFSTELAGLHSKLPRRYNAKRKFIHRVEELAHHLDETFDVRQQRFPQADLARYRQWLADARPMTGAQTSFRQRAAEREQAGGWWDWEQWFEGASKRMARQLKRFPARYAVRIRAKGRARAALYQNGAFVLAGVALTSAALQRGAARVGSHKIPTEAGSLAKQVDLSDVALGDALDVAEFSYDVGSLAGELAGVSGDCGGVDVPDCDVSDCGALSSLDCSAIDCGAIDCSGVDVPDCGGCDL